MIGEPPLEQLLVAPLLEQFSVLGEDPLEVAGHRLGFFSFGFRGFGLFLRHVFLEVNVGKTSGGYMENRGFGPTTRNNPSRGARILNFLMKRQPSRQHSNQGAEAAAATLAFLNWSATATTLVFSKSD